MPCLIELIVFRYDWSSCEGKYNCVQSLKETNIPECGSLVYLQVEYTCEPGKMVAMLAVMEGTRWLSWWLAMVDAMVGSMVAVHGGCHGGDQMAVMMAGHGDCHGGDQMAVMVAGHGVVVHFVSRLLFYERSLTK